MSDDKQTGEASEGRNLSENVQQKSESSDLLDGPSASGLDDVGHIPSDSGDSNED